MQRQIPPGPTDCKCPLWRKPMAEVCHTCPLWVQMRGQHPQTAQEIDQWNCSLALLPIMLVEVGRQQRSTAAAMETMTSEMKKADKDSTANIATLVTLLNRSLDVQTAVIANGHAPRLIAQGD